MPQQVQKTKQAQTTAPQETEIETPSVDAEETLEDIDGLLDEIDAVLEENAQEFIAAYVQKGGE